MGLLIILRERKKRISFLVKIEGYKIEESIKLYRRKKIYKYLGKKSVYKQNFVYKV